jgi:hypothetical protein
MTSSHKCVIESPPNNSLQLTRLACGRGRVPGLPDCGGLSEPLPEPPGSCPSRARGAARSSRPLGGLDRFPVCLYEK